MSFKGRINYFEFKIDLENTWIWICISMTYFGEIIFYDVCIVLKICIRILFQVSYSVTAIFALPLGLFFLQTEKKDNKNSVQ